MIPIKTEAENFINHIIEPKSLQLIWQSPQDDSHKRLIVAKLYKEQNNINLKYLTGTKDFLEAQTLGFKGYSAFTLEKDQYDDVLQSFLRRLPPRKREDFDDYIKSFRIKPDAIFSDFALLGYTGAKLPSDSFSILHTFEDATGPFEFMLEAAGFRFENIINPGDSGIGQKAEFEKSYSEKLKEDVIKIKIADRNVGYVTRGLVPTFSKWIDENRVRSAIVEKKNGTQDKPVLFLYVEIK